MYVYIYLFIFSWGATSQMQPTAARRALPCYDEPGIKAMFNTTIEYRTKHIAITNGIELTNEDLPGGWRRTTYKPTPPMSTYILAFTVGVFDYKQVYTKNGVRVSDCTKLMIAKQNGKLIRQWGDR